MKKSKKLIAICGATASGKTDIAIKLAQYYNTSILSFDSRQCYKELNIGVAKPTIEDLQLIPHYFINSHSIFEPINAVIFENYGLQVLQKLFLNNDIVIAVGGTGLYLNALCNGVDLIPEIPQNIRTNLQEKFALNGTEWLKAEIQKLDKSYNNVNDLNNTHRMLRALEVILHTGNSIKYYQQNKKVERDFEVVQLCTNLNRTILYERINTRVDAMIENGLVEEVKNLEPHKNLNALQTVGYTELFNYFENKISLEKAVELIKQHSRNYAKRQITWFKNVQKIEQNSIEDIVKIIEN